MFNNTKQLTVKVKSYTQQSTTVMDSNTAIITIIDWPSLILTTSPMNTVIHPKRLLDNPVRWTFTHHHDLPDNPVIAAAIYHRSRPSSISTTSHGHGILLKPVLDIRMALTLSPINHQMYNSKPITIDVYLVYLLNTHHFHRLDRPPPFDSYWYDYDL